MIIAQARCLKCKDIVTLEKHGDLKQCMCGEIYIMSSRAVKQAWGNSLRPGFIEWIKNVELP